MPGDGAAMPGSSEGNIASLQRSWRKVASTHDLQALTEDDAEPKRQGSWKTRLLGWVLLWRQQAALWGQASSHAAPAPRPAGLP
jgi:hypothetical protein